MRRLGISSYLFLLVLLHQLLLPQQRKTILIDQFLVIHALAWLVVDEFDLFHLFLVINGLQEFVADRADLNHDF
jgi:hypothetical protein